MWWQYLIMAIVSISAALLAVHVDHWKSRRNEYRKAISSVKNEVSVNISICDINCTQIETDIDLFKKDQLSGTPYFPFHELAWNTWESTILLRNSELADKIEKAYFYLGWTNGILKRVEELKWEPVGALLDTKTQRMGDFEQTKRYLSGTLLPRLKGTKELLEERLLPQLMEAKELLERES
jgi:hypothetical protein